MIINFKIFEILNYTNNIPLYKWGDYVLLDIDKIKKNLKKEKLENIQHLPDDILAQIIYQDVNSDRKVTYDVVFPTSNKDEGYEVKDNEIVRLLNSKEINIYKEKKKLNKSVKKYNL